MSAEQTVSAAGSAPSAQVVGNAFVHQYYHVLHQSPELVHRFYQENSKLGRPEGLGEMSLVSGMEAIDEKIQSMGYADYRAAIKTVDSQESLDGGVIVLVTGLLTGKDDVKRNFTQSFFLATQEKGYYVLNDIFRYVEEGDDQYGSQIVANCNSAPVASEQEAPAAAVPITEPPEEEDEENEEEVYDPSEDGDGSVVEEEAPVAEVIDEVPNSSQAVIAESNLSNVPEESPKQSYASIVRVMKQAAASSSVPAPAPTPTRAVTVKLERQVIPTSSPESVSDPNVAESNNNQETEVDGHSIYIRSLPLSATVQQLEEEFKRFGTIKTNGIQVRSNKPGGFCFGFVEFEEASAVQSAIEASPITIGGRQAFVEEKRPAGSRVSRPRFPPGRGSGFRNDGPIRGRGSYGGGRGYGRSNYSSRGEFVGRGSGRGVSSNRGSESYQRVDHTGSGGGRGNRQGPTATNSSKSAGT